MIVELLGMPGSGKSTLNKLLRADLKSSYCTTLSFEDALILYFQKRHHLFSIVKLLPPQYHLPLYRALFRLWVGRTFQMNFYLTCHTEIRQKVSRSLQNIKKKSPEEYKQRRQWLEIKIRQYVLYKIVTKEKSLIALSDEGLSSSIGNLFINSASVVDIDTIKAFLVNWPLPDVLIDVEAETSICIERLAQRGLPELLKNKSNQAITTGLENQALLDKTIINEARRRGIQVYSIKNEYDSINHLKNSNSLKSLVNMLKPTVPVN